MVNKVVVLVLSGMFLVSTARSQSDCEPISFVWEHPSSSEAPVKVKCSDSTRDFVWSIGTEPHDWELPESTLASMPLAVRYETFYQLSLSRGTFAGLVEEAKQTLELSDVDVFLVLVDLVRELPYLQTFGGEQSPESTLALGRGDCSDKSLLLATLLGELGIETLLVLDDVNEHAFLAFPAEEEGVHFVVETTNPKALIFEEQRLSEGQTVVPLSPNETSLESQYDLLNLVLRWQAESVADHGPWYIYSNCEIRQRLLQMASLEARRDSVMHQIESVEQEIGVLQRQLDHWIEKHNAQVAAYNLLTEEIDDIIQSLNEWNESSED